MLLELNIQNFAVIEKTSIKPHKQFTAITGETGAGKSMLVDALTLLQGARADKSHIQAGKKSAQIEGVFCVQSNTAAKQWLAAQGFLKADKCTIKRVIDQTGKSRIYINNFPCTLQTLKGLGQHLIQIHAQHQYHELLDKEKHLEFVDQFGKLSPQTQKTKEAFALWRTAVNHLTTAQKAYDSTKQRYDLLQYQTNELAELDLTPETLRANYEKHQRLSNTEHLLTLCQRVKTLIDDDDDWSLMRLSQTTQKELADNRVPLKPLEEVSHLLQEQSILLQECLNHLDDAESALEHDPAHLAELEDYLEKLNTLARKHRVTPEALPEHAQSLYDEMQHLAQNDLDIEKLSDEAEKRWLDYYQKATILSERRRISSKKLGRAITEYIRKLGMPDAELSFKIDKHHEHTPPTATPVNLPQTPKKANAHTNQNSPKRAHHPKTPSKGDHNSPALNTIDYTSLQTLAAPTGFDQGELMLKNHPKLPAITLRKTASGGELSRVSLALFMLIQQGSGQFLIFDEVDTGMGGQIGDLLGQHLQKLSNTKQLLCITHLPQVAARSDKHIHVSKTTNKTAVMSEAIELSAQDRQDELARMLGVSTLPEAVAVAASEHWQSASQSA